jgi:hypothetical protein
VNDLDLLVLETTVYADAAHVTDLVLAGQTEAADAYAIRPEVANRIRLWKANRP